MFNGGSSSYTVTVINCTFTGNSASHSGGGMYNNTGSLVVTNCTFTGNSAHDRGGGGMFNFSHVFITVTNCTFTGNSANYGAGMCNYASCTVTNCTFSLNSASGYGGGGMYNGVASPVLTNCILQNNSATLGPEFCRDTTNPTFRHCDIRGCGGSGASWDRALGTDGGGNIMADARFIDAANPAGPDGLWRTGDDGLGLQADSPCIDAGTADGAPANDILGHPRVGAPDIGTYEFQTPQITVTSPSGGESWQQLTAQTIRWVSAGDCGPNVRIVSFKAGQWERTIQTETPNDGAHAWSLPPDLTLGADYQIKVVSTSMANCSGLSGAFSISAAGAGVQVSCPNTGVDWPRGSTVRIRWSCWGDVGGQVKINLYRGRNQWVKTISLSTPNSGDYPWTIPGDVVPRADYRIKITSVSKPQYYDFSDHDFSIHAVNAVGASWRRY